MRCRIGSRGRSAVISTALPDDSSLLEPRLSSSVMSRSNRLTSTGFGNMRSATRRASLTC